MDNTACETYKDTLMAVHSSTEVARRHGHAWSAAKGVYK